MTTAANTLQDSHRIGFIRGSVAAFDGPIYASFAGGFGHIDATFTGGFGHIESKDFVVENFIFIVSLYL
jgi:hypothetical protein